MFGKNRNFNRRLAEDYGLIRTFYITWFLYFVVWPAATLFYTAKIEGWNNIDRSKRYVYTSNHQSYIDPPLISLIAKNPPTPIIIIRSAIIIGPFFFFFFV